MSQGLCVRDPVLAVPTAHDTLPRSARGWLLSFLFSFIDRQETDPDRSLVRDASGQARRPCQRWLLSTQGLGFNVRGQPSAHYCHHTPLLPLLPSRGPCPSSPGLASLERSPRPPGHQCEASRPWEAGQEGWLATSSAFYRGLWPLAGFMISGKRHSVGREINK